MLGTAYSGTACENDFYQYTGCHSIPRWLPMVALPTIFTRVNGTIYNSSDYQFIIAWHDYQFIIAWQVGMWGGGMYRLGEEIWAAFFFLVLFGMNRQVEWSGSPQKNTSEQ
jgi:hypothetical protein